MAALLHDVIEDTPYSAKDIEERFGSRVRKIVEECSDDKNKNKQQRKQAQIDGAPKKSIEASEWRQDVDLRSPIELTSSSRRARQIGRQTL